MGKKCIKESENWKGRDYLRDLSTDESAILKETLEKLYVTV
jgi:hypothetical protein